MADVVPPNESVHFTTIQKWSSGKQVPGRNFIAFVDNWPNLEERQRQVLVAAWKATRTGDDSALEALVARLEPNGGAITSTEWYPLDVDRRDALRKLASVTGGTIAAGGLASAWLSRDTIDGSLDEWEELAWSYGRAYRSLTPAMVPTFIEVLSADIIRLGELVKQMTGNSYSKMQSSSAYMYGVLALALKELGQENLPNVLKVFHNGVYAADQSGNAFARVWIRGQAAREYVYTFNAPDRAVSIADEALLIDPSAFGEPIVLELWPWRI